MGRSNYVHVEYEYILKETDKAFLVALNQPDHDDANDDGLLEAWLPKSQIADWEQYEEGDKNGTMSITEYIAREKGLATDD